MADDETVPGAARRAVVLAGHRGDPEKARAGLRHADARVRSAALGALARLSAMTADDIEIASNDVEPAVRRRAAESAIAIGDRPLLIGLLADPDSTVVETAAWALGEIDSSPTGGDGSAGEAVDALRAIATDHADSLCREAAVASIGAIGDPAGLPTILTALDDKATVRRRAVIALAPFEGPDVDAALSRSLDDRDAQVRQVAEDLLDPNR